MSVTATDESVTGTDMATEVSVGLYSRGRVCAGQLDEWFTCFVEREKWLRLEDVVRHEQVRRV